MSIAKLAVEYRQLPPQGLKPKPRQARASSREAEHPRVFRFSLARPAAPRAVAIVTLPVTPAGRLVASFAKGPESGLVFRRGGMAEWPMAVVFENTSLLGFSGMISRNRTPTVAKIVITALCPDIVSPRSPWTAAPSATST
jgi:hypothetical protein